MSKQVIGVGTVANDGTGDTERAAWIKQKLNNDELFYGKEILLGGRKPIIAFAGDSIAGQFGSYTTGTSSPMFHALMRLTHRDFYMDNSTANADGTGGYGFGVGGSPSSYLNTDWSGNTAIITKLAAKAIKPDILFVQTLQNNAMNVAKSSIDGYLAEVTTFVPAALALGVQLVVLMPRPPYNGQAGTTVADGHAYCNAVLAEYARITPGVEFVNWLPQVKDPSDANENNGASSVVAWRAPNATGGWSDSAGVHPNSLTTRAIAPLLVPILEQFGRPITPRAAYFRAFDETTFPLGSWLGRHGMMVGTGGQLNGANNAGVAGSSQAAFQRWEITTTNGVTVTPSKIVHADGYDRQRMTLGGTASGVGTITLVLNRSNNVAASTLWIQEAMLDFASVVGLRDWSLQLPLGVGGDSLAFWSDDVRSVTGPITESYFLRTLKPRTFVNASSGTHATTLTLNIASGVSPTGDVDLGRIGMWRIA